MISPNKIRFLVPISFFAFICWIIFMADSGEKSVFFDLVKAFPYGDKVGHVVLYGVLALLLNFALNFRWVKILGFHMQVGALMVFAFAFVEELSQYFFVNRTLDEYDMLADFVGVLLFSLIKPRRVGRSDFKNTKR